MDGKRLFSVGSFAKLARVTLVMLHHYDKMGLLSPALRAENGYRYYSITQLSEVNLVRTMQESGLSLREIKALKDSRTPQQSVRMLMQQIEKIDERAQNLAGARKLMEALLLPILSVADVDENTISVQPLPSSHIVLGDWNRYADGENGYDALVVFYHDILKRYSGINVNYPVWGLFTKDNLKIKMSGEHTWPERYYFYSPDGRDTRPGGLYAIGYARGDYGHNDNLYVRMRDWIEKNGYEVCGDAYEEYPLNEICISSPSNYLMRVMINVKKKKG